MTPAVGSGQHMHVDTPSAGLTLDGAKQEMLHTEGDVTYAPALRTRRFQINVQ